MGCSLVVVREGDRTSRLVLDLVSYSTLIGKPGERTIGYAGDK